MRSKYDCRTTSPSGPGSSENIQRIGWFTANTQRPPGRSTLATSRITCPGSATNGTAPNAEHARSNAPSRNGSAAASAWTSGTAAPVERPKAAAWRSMPPDRSSATGHAPARSSHRELAAAHDVTEQLRVLLPQPLGAPHEVEFADVGAVLGQVVVGVGVPPPTARA